MEQVVDSYSVRKGVCWVIFSALLGAFGLAHVQAAPVIPEKSLYSFSSTSVDSNFDNTNKDGVYPSGLIYSGGMLYGTTESGGTNGYGTVFAVNTNGTGYKVLHTFSNDDSTTNRDGANPVAGLVLSGATLYGTAARGGTNDRGAVFKVNIDGTGFAVLHRFSGGVDGANPVAGLTVSGNMLYGTTVNGGTNTYGTIFKVNTNGNGFAVLHTFDLPDGTYPSAADPNSVQPLFPLTLSGNTLYGAAPYDGANGFGTVFTLGTDGSNFTVLYDFSDDFAGNLDGASPFCRLVLSGDTLYGTTEIGGTNDNGTIFAVNTNGSGFTVLHFFSTATSVGNNQFVNYDGINPEAGLILSGNLLYGTTFGGGSASNGVAFAMTIDGSAFSTLYNFAGIPDGGNPQANLVASGGNFYGTTTFGGTNDNGSIFGLFTDVQKPTVAFTYPTNVVTTNNSAFTFKGTARDNAFVTNVLYSFNGSDWTNPATANNWSNWNAQVTLIPGTNKFAVYAVDSSGNISATNNAIVFYTVKVPLGLAKVGKGTFNGATNGQLFAIGRIVTLTTSNGVGYILTNWLVQVGGVTVISNNKAVPFQMQSNTTVTATFADVKKPTVTFTYPTNTVTTTNTTITVRGTASDNAAVAAVYYSVAGSSWASAQNLGNWTNWKVMNVPLALGTNVIQAYAQDTNGLGSSVVVAKVVRLAVPVIKPIYRTNSFHNPQAQIAFDGNNYMVAFQTVTNGMGIPTAQLVTTGGVAAAAQVQIPVAGGADPPALVFDKTNYLVAWDQDDSTIHGQYLDTTSTPIGSPFQISQSTNVDSFGTMVFGGGVYFLMWSDSSGAGSDDIYGTTFSADGTFGSGDFLIGNGGSENLAGGPTAAFDGNNFLATWGGANGKYSVMGRLITPAGAYITDPFVIYTNSALPAGPALQSVVFDGTKYLVMFSVGAGSGASTNWHNAGRFVTTNGVALTNKITFTSDVGPQITPCGTFDGTRYLVTWNQGFNPFNVASVGTVLARFFDVNGKPASGEFTLFSPAAGQTALWAPVLFNGTQYFSVGGFGQTLSPAPNLTFTNGVIKDVIISP